MTKCGEQCEVYSRVCGYFRPVSNWNRGKQAEFKERLTYSTEQASQYIKEENRRIA
jgi:virulence-associated protein VapD